MNRFFCATLVIVGCDTVVPTNHDAGNRLLFLDGGPASDDAPSSLVVDFSVEGCPEFDSSSMTCTGSVPLTLRFVPLATAAVTKYLWDFGDVTAAETGQAPVHRYETPGTFTVKVVATGGGGGLVTRTRTGFVVAQANPAGGPCATDTQCATGLFCLCPSSAACDGAFTNGLCVSSCAAAACPSDLVCAELGAATPKTGAAQPWQAPLCLRACGADADCAAGFRCRTLPPRTPGQDWVRGCFAAIPADVGASCSDASDRQRDDLCSSGLCLALGKKGLCSANCATAPCPPGSTCTLFGDGRRLCLRPCLGGFGCDQDPLLTCVSPGGGDLGFSLVNPSPSESATSFCAPKPCFSDEPCLPTGTCVAQASGSHCMPRTN